MVCWKQCVFKKLFWGYLLAELATALPGFGFQPEPGAQGYARSCAHPPPCNDLLHGAIPSHCDMMCGTPSPTPPYARGGQQPPPHGRNGGNSFPTLSEKSCEGSSVCLMARCPSWQFRPPGRCERKNEERHRHEPHHFRGESESWRAGELISWRVGELESRRAGELESWRAEKLESWSAGELES